MSDPRIPPDGFTGTWVHRLPDGSRRETDYLDGVPSGHVRIYGWKGQLHREAGVHDGQWHGQMKVWSSEGDLLDTSEFDHGTGVYRIFYSSGKLAWEIQLDSGQRHGTTKRWDGRGRLVLVQHYRHGELVSEDVPKESEQE